MSVEATDAGVTRQGAGVGRLRQGDRGHHGDAGLHERREADAEDLAGQ